MRVGLRVHFLHYHVQETVIIVDESNLPHPRCPLCDIMVLWVGLNGLHPNTAQCEIGLYRKRRRLAADEGMAII